MARRRSVWLSEKSSSMLDDFISDKKIMKDKVTISGVVNKAVAYYVEHHKEDQEVIQYMIRRQLEDEEFYKTQGPGKLVVSGMTEDEQDDKIAEDEDKLKELFETSKFNPKNRDE